MISYIIPLVSSFVGSSLWTWFFLPMIALCFVATVPCIIRYCIGLRR